MDKRLLDKTWRLKNLYKIRNKDSQLVKFKRNRAQEHFNQYKWNRNLILKSRQLGFTTDEAIDSTDDVLFKRNMDALLIAHNLDAGRAIFDKKIDLAWKTIHPELRKLWKVDASTAQTLKFEFGDGTFSSIIVDTTGRSGTFQRVHITEFAEICKKYPQKAKDIIEGTLPAVPLLGRIDIESTSQGASGDFYEMFMFAWERGEPTLPSEYKAHFYNWTWDDEEISKVLEPIPFNKMVNGDKFEEYAARHNLTPIQITYYYQKWLTLNRNWNSLHREYPTTPEEAFDAIAEGTYYGEVIGQAEREGRIGIVPYDRALKVHTVWDLGVGENLVVGFFQRSREGQIRQIDYWAGEGSDGMPEAINAVLKKPYIYGKHFGPHDIEATDVSTGKSRRETAKALGITFTIVPDISVEDGINACSLFLSRLWVDKDKCKKWVKAIKNYCREWDEKRGMYKEVPYHNWASHGADMSRYAAVVEDKMTNDTQILNRPFYDRTVEIWNDGQRDN